MADRAAEPEWRGDRRPPWGQATGDILSHEPMGVVEKWGPAVPNLRPDALPTAWQAVQHASVPPDGLSDGPLTGEKA